MVILIQKRGITQQNQDILHHWILKVSQYLIFTLQINELKNILVHNKSPQARYFAALLRMYKDIHKIHVCLYSMAKSVQLKIFTNA